MAVLEGGFRGWERDRLPAESLSRHEVEDAVLLQVMLRTRCVAACHSRPGMQRLLARAFRSVLGTCACWATAGCLQAADGCSWAGWVGVETSCQCKHSSRLEDVGGRCVAAVRHNATGLGMSGPFVGARAPGEGRQLCALHGPASGRHGSRVSGGVSVQLNDTSLPCFDVSRAQTEGAGA